MIHAQKRDDNEDDIVKALRGAGATVMHLSGKGVPDLLVGYHGHTLLIEVKNPDGKSKTNSKGDVRKKRGTFTKNQVKSFASWTGGPIYTVVSEVEAIAVLGIPRSAT